MIALCPPLNVESERWRLGELDQAQGGCNEKDICGRIIRLIAHDFDRLFFNSTRD